MLPTLSSRRSPAALSGYLPRPNHLLLPQWSVTGIDLGRMRRTRHAAMHHLARAGPLEASCQIVFLLGKTLSTAMYCCPVQ